MSTARLASASGLVALVAEGGALASLGTDEVELVQHPASAFEPGLTQVWLRDRTTNEAWPLLGAGSGGTVTTSDDAIVVSGESGGLQWRAALALHPRALSWAWHVDVVHRGTGERTVDLVHTHDVAASGRGALRANELYVSQYLDLAPLDGPTGTALAIRQNLPQAGERHPWVLLAADRDVVSWATDALDVHGLGWRGGRPGEPPAELPGRRRQHEHTLAALQVAPVVLRPGDTFRTCFAGLLVPHHPAATTPDDARLVPEVLALAAETRSGETPAVETAPAAAPGRPSPSGPYDHGRQVAARPLIEDEVAERWPGPWRAVERDDAGTLLSCFAGDEHVVTQAKERAVLRPHGTILRSGAAARPELESLTVTAWMTGSPVSYLTRGHVTTGRTLTTVRGYLGAHRAYGLRVHVEVDGRWQLLDLPSAFAMTLDAARWVYALGDGSGTVELRTHVPADDHRVGLSVEVAGTARRVLVALHIATPEEPLPAGRVDWQPTLDGVVVRLDGGRSLSVRASSPVEVGDDRRLFDDGRHRADGVVTLVADGSVGLDLAVTERDPDVTPARTAGGDWWREVTPVRVAHADAAEIEPLAVSLPWLVRDALVHYLAPRGLEQYTGGAWGTRDVTQGPLELLLALDRLDDARWLVLRVFAAQNPDGSWPQAFGFLPGDEDFRHEPPHGDVVHWPVLALGRYLLASGDVGILDEPAPWYADDDAPAPLRTHLARALEHARASFLPGTHLVAYGHGDWNDSLQPADPAMTTTMVSAWTVTLHHQSLATLVDALAEHPSERALVAELGDEAAAVAADLERYLLVDGELAGYVRLAPPEADDESASVVAHLVHPRDEATGLRHGALQMIHALGADLLDPVGARAHVSLVHEHLMGVDGVRLFDRPPRYHGGETHHFQRAETATFVGREIGLMYVHAHLRWCEAMARWGDAEALWHGLRQVLPPAATATIPGAARRQGNTYASSSDADVLDRAAFSARYAEVLTGATGLEAGWRVYSSGPGVLVRVLTQSFLGVRRRGEHVELDPVVPARLDGLVCEVPLAAGVLRLRVHVGPSGAGVTAVRLGDEPLTGTPTHNPYRRGGLRVAIADLAPALAPDGPIVEVDLA